MNFLKKISTVVSIASFLFITTSSTVSANELEELQEKGVMRIAMEGTYPPFNYVDDKNEVVGFDPAIGRELAKRLGMEVEIVTTTWSGILAGLLSNKYDAIVGSMTITEKKEKVVDFVGPYYNVRRAIYVRSDSNIKGLKDLKDKRVGATLGETHEKWSKAHDSWKVQTYQSLTQLLMDLKIGRIDAIVNDNIPVLALIEKNGIKVKELDIPNLAALPAGIAIRKGNEKLKEAMQKALESMQKDGTVEKIAKKWVGLDIR